MYLPQALCHLTGVCLKTIFKMFVLKLFKSSMKKPVLLATIGQSKLTILGRVSVSLII
jgi:hypothetical protein